MNLIKFFKYNHFLLEGLANQTLYFCNVAEFNDPFDGIFRYRVSNDFEKFEEFYKVHFQGPRDKLQYYFENKREFEKLLNRVLEQSYKNNSVCCFANESNIDDILMWSHYADGHKGLCLVFKTEQIDLTPVDKFANGIAIVDPKPPHEVTYIDKYLDGDPLKNELRRNAFLTTKFKKWSAEKEFRFIGARP
jgi:hypothetical protein